MKKLCTLFAVAMLLTLAGCKDATANISNGSTALITVDGDKITNDDIYKLVKKTDGAATTLRLIQDKIADKENIKIDDAMKKEAEESTKSLKSMYGDKLDATLKQNGYTNLDDYTKKVVYPSLRVKKLTNKYVEEKSDSLFKTYMPMKAQILEADDEKKAKSALDALKKGDNFTDVVKKYGTTTTFNGKEDIYSSLSGLPATVFDKMKSTNKKGLIESVISDTESKKYYVVNLTNVDPASFKEDAVKNIVEKGGNDVQNASLSYYLKKYDFKVYDKDIYDGIKTINESFLTQK